MAGALAAVLMATIHVLFHLPAGVLGIAFYQALAAPERFGGYVVPLWTLYLLSMSVSVFGSLADFFIYLYAFPAFRSSSLQLLSRLFFFRYTNSHEVAPTSTVRGISENNHAVAGQIQNGARIIAATFESSTAL